MSHASTAKARSRKAKHFLSHINLEANEIAEYCNTSNSAVYKWQRGTCAPRLSKLEKLEELSLAFPRPDPQPTPAPQRDLPLSVPQGPVIPEIAAVLPIAQPPEGELQRMAVSAIRAGTMRQRMDAVIAILR